ncbi:hypothetical protein Purlil1_2632 [Purpureocillium lilacinum]|uniref:Uncharacterized protein n=1 Tax=Purpureocillium lilacinum TaxID=33203 RepID=A0ABR0C8M3_PURLI|nr:hypothetical protein Purlil1_2632 [Purpureocillium lilacinum]
MGRAGHAASPGADIITIHGYRAARRLRRRAGVRGIRAGFCVGGVDGPTAENAQSMCNDAVMTLTMRSSLALHPTSPKLWYYRGYGLSSSIPPDGDHVSKPLPGDPSPRPSSSPSETLEYVQQDSKTSSPPVARQMWAPASYVVHSRVAAGLRRPSKRPLRIWFPKAPLLLGVLMDPCGPPARDPPARRAPPQASATIATCAANNLRPEEDRAASHARTPSPLSPLWAVADLRKSPRARTRPVRRGGRANLERNSHRAAGRVAVPRPPPPPPFELHSPGVSIMDAIYMPSSYVPPRFPFTLLPLSRPGTSVVTDSAGRPAAFPCAHHPGGKKRREAASRAHGVSLIGSCNHLPPPSPSPRVSEDEERGGRTCMVPRRAEVDLFNDVREGRGTTSVETLCDTASL